MSPPLPLGALAGDFDLVDHQGRSVRLADYAGRLVVLFFGFTHCQVVCPRALTKLNAVIRHVDPSRDLIQGLYVTVDPARDDPSVMEAYLRPAYPRFDGVTGEVETLADMRKAYRVYAQRREEAGGNYSVPHSALIHVLDRQGRHIDHWPETLEESVMIARLRRLLG
ncbi:MAG: SCO family protein [Caulobacter sp.]|nr:SCO family protein [Caulobacter sp.]